MKIKNLLISLLLVVLLCSCTSSKTTETTSPNESGEPSGEETGYPVTEYSFPTDEGYPVEDPMEGYTQGPEFNIDLPVSGGDLTVTGTGPADVPIILVDVTEFALILGETTIETNGTFNFTLADPLDSGHTIGLMLGDIEGTDFVESDFLYSETYFERPLIGILFDMVVVE